MLKQILNVVCWPRSIFKVPLSCAIGLVTNFSPIEGSTAKSKSAGNVSPLLLTAKLNYRSAMVIWTVTLVGMDRALGGNCDSGRDRPRLKGAAAEEIYQVGLL
jgi:hypothetical protein